MSKKCPVHAGRRRAPSSCADCAAIKAGQAAAPIAVPTAAPNATIPTIAPPKTSKRFKRSRSDEYERSSSNPFPYVTEDGTSWLDAHTGQPAQVDADGRLVESFVLELVSGARERWAAGMKLPPTPYVWDTIVVDLVAKKPKR